MLHKEMQKIVDEEQARSQGGSDDPLLDNHSLKNNFQTGRQYMRA